MTKLGAVAIAAYFVLASVATLAGYSYDKSHRAACRARGEGYFWDGRTCEKIRPLRFQQ
jgi:hypothetical protein